MLKTSKAKVCLVLFSVTLFTACATFKEPSIVIKRECPPLARIAPVELPKAPVDAAINDSGKSYIITLFDAAYTNYNALTNINKACSQD